MEQISVFAAAIQSGTLDRVILAAKSQARGCGSDEKTHECLERMARCFKEASAIYRAERDKIGTFSLRSIIDGINSDIEAKAEDFSIFERDGFNPVSMELTRIIGEKTHVFIARFEELARRYWREEAPRLVVALKREAGLNPWGCCADDAFFRQSEAIKESVSKFFLRLCYESSQECLAACVGELNSPGGRKEAEAFREMLKRERESADELMGKLAALESELYRNAGNSVEQRAAGRMLAALKEGCVCFSSQADGILADLAREEKESAPFKEESFEEYEAAFSEMFANCRLICRAKYFEAARRIPESAEMAIWLVRESMPVFLEKAAGTVYSRLLKDPSKIGREGFALSLMERIQSEKDMSEEIVAVFTRQLSFYRERCAQMEKLPENDIMKGINETLMIKAESLAENTAAFAERARLLAERAASLSAAPSAEEAQALEREALVQFLRLFTPVPESKEALSATFEMMHRNCASVLEGFAERLAAEMARHRAALDKAVASFRKDVLLFEVSTYEEIVQYSVSRLRSSASELVSDFAGGMDDGILAIERALSRRGIKSIKPSPHDMFNGREHEVLMAEKSEGFGKGEIIKLMTSGYKQDASVLVRANVIAAR
jgi:molecular chaperone GrpE (heat shock protein)